MSARPCATRSTLFPYTTLFRSTQLLQSFIDYLKCGRVKQRKGKESVEYLVTRLSDITDKIIPLFEKYPKKSLPEVDRKSTRLSSSHVKTSYAVFRLKKKITIRV